MSESSKKDMICAAVRDLMPSYIEQLTEEATNAFIEQHLAECPACREVKRAMLHIETPAERAQSEFHDRLRRAHRRSVRRAWIAGTLIVLILYACFLPVPRFVHMDVEAVKWRAGNPEWGFDVVDISIHGTYMDYLIRNKDYFSGYIMIEGVDISQNEGTLSHMNVPMFDAYGGLWYSDAVSLLNGAGSIAGPPGFSEFIILLNETKADGGNGWESDNGLVITYPARTRSEAVTATQRICRQNDVWLAKAVWEGGMTRVEFDMLHPKKTAVPD